ncbi:MAG: hypothetical protein HQK86_09330 [Nitrospinae bacterium]|nr:hypothetical protein [Nitrospinota bacterium]MBF0633096.1 hypothetical protein [Nitrospinota bacterium]
MRGSGLASIFFIAITLFPASAPRAQDADNPTLRAGVGRVGDNLSKHGKSLIALDDDISLEIDPAIIAKGDRLKLIPKTGDTTALGWLVVTSGDGEPPRGKVRGASREIPADSNLEFVIDDNEQVNAFLPFIKSLTSAFYDDPLKGPLRVAVIDVVNPYGERTQAGDTVLETISRHICGRPQFECVKREKIVEEMWRLRVPTSRGLSVHSEKALMRTIGDAVMVTGHLRLSETGEAELVLLARSQGRAKRDGGVWRKFVAPQEMFGTGKAAFERVTVKYADVPTGLLKFRLANSPQLDGMQADHIGSSDLGGWMSGHDGDGGITMEPSRHFVFVDGESLAMNPDGNFRELPVAAGERRVRIGYYPQATGVGVALPRPARPVEKSFEIHVNPGETVEITILSGIIGTHGIIAADLLTRSIVNTREVFYLHAFP